MPSTISGGTGDCRLCGRWDAIPKPVSHAPPASSISTFAGLVLGRAPRTRVLRTNSGYGHSYRKASMGFSREAFRAG